MNMFECIEISEHIYKGVLETYKRYPVNIPTVMLTAGLIQQKPYLKTFNHLKGYAGNINTGNENRSSGKLKPCCMIHRKVKY